MEHEGQPFSVIVCWALVRVFNACLLNLLFVLSILLNSSGSINKNVLYACATISMSVLDSSVRKENNTLGMVTWMRFYPSSN